MSLFTQLLMNGLIAGSIYALVAAGFSLIYATNRFVHIAHGVSVASGAYFLLLFFTHLQLSLPLSIILTLLASALLGVAMYQFIYLPLQNKKASSVILLIASVGLLILLENLIQLLFGASVQTINAFPIAKGISVLGAIITPLQIAILCTTLILLISLYFFMKKTTLGRHLRAIADNKELASIMGINAKKITYIAFALSATLAGVAGILIGLEQNLTPTMGTDLIVKGLTGSIIGGVTSVPASILGSFILGFAENFGVWFLPSGYKDAITFTLLFIFLIFKPTGLFGLNKGVKS